MLKINRKTFIIFTVLLSVIAPGVYLYYKSDYFACLEKIALKTWLDCMVICFTVLALLIVYAIKKNTISFAFFFILNLVCIAVEPIYVCTVFPLLIGIWCFVALPPNEITLFRIVFSGCNGLSLAFSVYPLIIGINNYITNAITHFRGYVIALETILLCFGVLILIALSKIKTPKKQTGKQLMQAKATKKMVALFFCTVFLILDFIAFWHYEKNYYIFYITFVLIFAVGCYLVGQRLNRIYKLQ